MRRSRYLSPALRASAGFPLQWTLFVAGLLVGGLVGLALESPLIGLAFLIGFAVVGTVWKPGEPVFAFCIGYQWLFIVTAPVYVQLVGSHPDPTIVGKFEDAVLVSLLGLICVALGIRCGLLFPAAPPRRANRKIWYETTYGVEQLFVCLLLLGGVHWFLELSPRQLWPSGEQIIHRILDVRFILLLLLLLSIIRQRRGYALGLIAIVYLILPTFTSPMAIFARVLIILLVALLSEWRPWSALIWERLRNMRILGWSIATALCILVAGVVWAGAVKPVWRPIVNRGDAGKTTFETLATFFTVAAGAVSTLDPGVAVEDFVIRLSSDIGLFGEILERVPNVVPHEEGALARRALQHICQPRLLFPDKEQLGSDSWIVHQYAGRAAAGEESGTSVGVGYMAEFYVDFGILGVAIGSLIYGMIAGVGYRLLMYVSPSYDLYRAVVAAVLILQFKSYGGELAKLLGGLIQSFILFAVFLWLLSPIISRVFRARFPRRRAASIADRRRPRDPAAFEMR